MAKQLKESVIRSVKFTYVGTEDDIKKFWIAAVRNDLIKRGLIDKRQANMK